MRIPAPKTREGLLARFAEEKSGSVAIIFSLSMFGVMMMIGAAIDYSRISHARQKISTAADAATIAAAKRYKELHESEAQIEVYANTFFMQNLSTGNIGARVKEFKVTVDPATNSVTTNVKSELDTSFTRIAGINSVSIPTTATAVFNQQDIEVGLQLDVTGSMNDRISGVRKIDSLKDATRDLIDILLPEGGTGTTKIRIGLAPFAAGVNVGSYASKVTGSSTNACAYERNSNAYEGTDDAPGGAARLKSRTDLTISAQSCPSGSRVMPISTDKTALKSAVNSMVTGGSTAGHLGTAWAWYLLSPNWSSVWPSDSTPAAYNDTDTLKIAVLMTDGLYNTVGGVISGSNVSTAAQKARDMCTAMRSKGIVIYSVGFIAKGDDPAAADTLKDCAGTNGKFYKAENGDELRQAFRTIANDISRLRLTN